jgi:hypothetical protein
MHTAGPALEYSSRYIAAIESGLAAELMELSSSVLAVTLAEKVRAPPESSAM